MKTYFNTLPTADELSELKESLRRAKISRIINDLVKCDTIPGVKKIVAQNAVYFRLWGILYKFAERAMIRIRHLEIQKRIYWSEFIN